MNQMRPGPGAFTTQASPMPARPTMDPVAGAPVGPAGGPEVASDPNALLAKLASMGLLEAPGGGGLTGTPTAPGMGPPPAGPVVPPTAAQPPGADPFMELESLLGRMPPELDMPVRPSRKSVFKPGKPGQPKSGMRAHEILNNPDMVATLQQRLSTWEAANPNKKLMGSHIKEMLPEVSAAQARTIKRLLDKALNKSSVGDMDSLMQRGAAKAMKG